MNGDYKKLCDDYADPDYVPYGAHEASLRKSYGELETSALWRMYQGADMYMAWAVKLMRDELESRGWL